MLHICRAVFVSFIANCGVILGIVSYLVDPCNEPDIKLWIGLLLWYHLDNLSRLLMLIVKLYHNS